MSSITQTQEPGSFSLKWALGVSILLHVILLLVTYWVPLMTPAMAVEPDEQTIEFSFAQPQDTSADEPASDLPPAPSDPTPTAVPDRAQQGEQDVPLPPSPTELPPEAVPAPEPSVVEEALIEPQEPAEVQEVEQVIEEVVEEPLQDQPGNELPVDDAATVRDASTPPAAQPPPTPKPRLDVNSALRDFGKSMSRRPPPPPRSAPPVQGGGSTPNNVFVPDLSALPSTGYGMGNLRFESTDFDWNDYGRQIYMAIWRAWHNRLHMTANEFDKWAFKSGRWYLDHKAAVRFTIQRNGQVTGIAVEGPSGCLPLDQSAVDALDEVVLPPLPAAFPREQETVHARFITIGDIRDMKRTLSAMKARGFF